ncbi:hypothetical protein HK098_006913 [Nowakowskiella sp. JEL0407]|nr:hypothetical protein HK098_006913 [Nowakowskiella sp. JEL0407]
MSLPHRIDRESRELPVACIRFPKTTAGALLLFVLVFVIQSVGAWDPDAGLVRSYTTDAVITGSSAFDALKNTVDNNTDTAWQSGACLPGGYIVRSDLNFALNACLQNKCNASSSLNINDATDGSPYTGASIKLVNGVSWLNVTLQTPTILRRVNLQAYNSANITVSAINPSGELINLGIFTPANSYTSVMFPGPSGIVIKALRLNSTKEFVTTELAALGTDCFEQVTYDFKSVKPVGRVLSKHWAPQAVSSQILLSNDSVTWVPVASLNASTTSLIDTAFPERLARYLQMRHSVTMTVDWAKVYMWEVAAFDSNGKFGRAHTPIINPKNMSDFVGINGIWGWGNGNTNLNDLNSGPRLYRLAAGNARNYHSLGWDIKDPDNIPNYDKMAAGGGTEVQWWLNWDTEYIKWVQAGFTVDASIQFTNKDFPMSVWNNSFLAGYNYGYAFAKHFGPNSTGAAFIREMEVGNEPWNYPASFYNSVLRGMASGAKAGNPAMKVMPCALQAHEPERANATDGNYIGNRVTPSEAPYLDILNIHVYSYIFRPDGVRIAVHPEHPMSSMAEIRNMMRFRDVNMPGKPVYVTEWGWDSPGVGEGCVSTECVSEQAQALYAVRGALMLAREGVERAVWFFYANDKYCNTLFCRSGLTGSALTNFAVKRSFRALQSLLALVGNRNFVGVIREDSGVRIYQLGTSNGTVTDIIAWLPISADDSTTSTISANITGYPQSAWYLAGLSTNGEPAALPAVSGGTWQFLLSAVPLLVRVSATPPPIPTLTTTTVSKTATSISTTTFTSPIPSPTENPNWKPDAGMVVPWTRNASISASSSQDPTFLARTIDNNTDTFWQSDGCFPWGFISRPELNILMGTCEISGRCSTSSGSVNTNAAADGRDNTSFWPAVKDGAAWFKIAIPSPRTLIRVSLKAIASQNITITAITSDKTNITLGTYTVAMNYEVSAFIPPQQAIISALVVSSPVGFAVGELAAISDPCYEFVTYDFGVPREVGWIDLRHWTPNALNTTLWLSLDNINWVFIEQRTPGLLPLISTRLDTPKVARFFQIRETAAQSDWAKSYVWELAIYDRYGPYGPSLLAKVNPHNMTDFLGINGIWGWGTGLMSTVNNNSTGPKLYRQIAKHARNYHNMYWDVNDPDHIPDYEKMAAGKGTEVFNWLNWDREYAAWVAAGFTVDVSIQFSSQSFPIGMWDNPYMAGYNYGYAFARHFGPTFGTGTVSLLEVGNEPWDYPASFYLEVLGGMAAGVKAGDPNMQVTSGSLQAHEPEFIGGSGGSYIGRRLTSIEAKNIDALNFHAYSYMTTAAGVRIAVMPEHPQSTMKGIRNMLRFRDTNMPNSPVYMTEWGWDSAGANEVCTAPECVSEKAQALYAIRGALILAREGADRAVWFFYANDKSCTTLYCRSGLTGSPSQNFALKRSFRALQTMLLLMGNLQFYSVVREDSTAYVYLMGTKSGASGLVAWLPIDAESTTVATVPVALEATPHAVWIIDGTSANGTVTTTPSVISGVWQLKYKSTTTTSTTTVTTAKCTSTPLLVHTFSQPNNDLSGATGTNSTGLYVIGGGIASWKPQNNGYLFTNLYPVNASTNQCRSLSQYSALTFVMTGSTTSLNVALQLGCSTRVTKQLMSISVDGNVRVYKIPLTGVDLSAVRSVVFSWTGSVAPTIYIDNIAFGCA